MAFFGQSPAVTSKGAALNRPSQPHGRALTHDVPSAGPVVRPGDETRPGGCGRDSTRYLARTHEERR
jgi:hypothetical protein